MPDDVPSSPPPNESSPEASDDSEFLFEHFVRESPIATAMLVACIILGAWLGYEYFGDGLAPARRIVGGAIAGFGSWLLVMIGRVI